MFRRGALERKVKRESTINTTLKIKQNKRKIITNEGKNAVIKRCTSEYE